MIETQRNWFTNDGTVSGKLSYDISIGLRSAFYRDSPHGKRKKPEQWWACEFPERPHVDRVTLYNLGCKACLIAMDAAEMQGIIQPSGVSLGMSQAAREASNSSFYRIDLRNPNPTRITVRTTTTP